jgi:signal peptide peptidase SppA
MIIEPGKIYSIFRDAKDVVQAAKEFKANWKNPDKEDSGDESEIINGTAVINVTGMVSRYRSWYGTSVECISEALWEAEKNQSIDRIVLNINSYGGSVDGISELHDQIKLIGQYKPVVAYIGGEGCSAAYWIASAAWKIVAEKSAIVGNIGVIMSAMKWTSENVEEISVLSSQSPNKNYDPFTESGKVQMQKLVDELAAVFISQVAGSRGLTPEQVVEKYGAGAVFVGQNALAAGLVDEIGNLTELLNSENLIGGGAMPTTQARPQAGANATAEMVDMDQIDREWLEKNNPDLIEEIKKMGVEEERKRQEEIDDVETESAEEEKEKVEARRNGLSAGALALRLSKAKSERKKSAINNLRADAAAIPALGAIPAATNQESANVIDFMRAAAKKAGGIK